MQKAGAEHMSAPALRMQMSALIARAGLRGERTWAYRLKSTW